MKQLPEGNTKVNAFGNVGLRWAQSDPKAALAWAQQLPEGPAKDRALRDIIGTAWALSGVGIRQHQPARRQPRRRYERPPMGLGGQRPAQRKPMAGGIA